MSPASLFRCAGAALTFAVAAPAVAQATSDYERGVAARLAGDVDSAVELLARAIAAEPANADAQLQYGLALLAAGRLDDADGAFRRTLEIAPRYDDARIGLARVQQRRGKREAAITELTQVTESNAEAASLRAALQHPAVATNAYRWSMDLDGSYSRVRNQKDWRDLSLRIGAAVTPEASLSGAIEYSRRFGEQDTYGELRLDHRLALGASVWLLAGATPGADFRPRWQVAGGAAVRLRDGHNGTVVTIEGRHSRYPGGNIQILNPGIEQYLKGGHWITARAINVVERGDHHFGWLARADVMASPRLRLFGGISDAPDVTEGVVVETFSLFGGLSFAISDRNSWRLFVNREDRAIGSDRLEIGTGIGVRF